MFSFKDYYIKNREKIKEYDEQYREKYADKIKQRKQKYYIKNRENILQKTKQYTKEHYQQAIQRSKQWQEDNPDKVKEIQKRYIEKYPEKVKEAYKKWKNKNPEYDKQWRILNPEKAHIIDIKSYNKRKRRLGFNPLNKYFEGSVAHHINKDDVIYISEENHRNIRHCLESGKNMDKINEIAMSYIY